MSDSSNEIRFYNRDKSHFEFTNFAKTSITIDKILGDLNLSPYLVGNWKTAEHLFQAAKFTEQNIIEEIRQAPDERFREEGGAFWLGNSGNGKYKRNIREDWHSIKLEVMYWVVKQKFLQNEWVKNKLLETGKKKLIEASEGNDNFWGQDDSGNGKNNLGKILERIRDEMTENQDSNHIPNNSPSKSPSSTSNPPSSIPEVINETPTSDIKQNNNEDLKKTQQKARQQIQKLFTENKIKPSELEAILWKNKSNWEEYLKELKNDQEITNFVQMMSEKIKEKYQSKQKNDSLISLNSPNKNSRHMLFWLLGGGILLIALFFFTKKIRRIRKVRKNKSAK